MFWENFYRLCKLHGETPASVCKKLGLSNAIATRWKKGNIPNTNTLNAIAEYFSVQMSELFAPNQNDKINSLTPHEKRLIVAYRNKPEMQNSVDKLLDIYEPTETIAEDISETIRKIESVQKADISKK